ncbi:hypothetical protein DSCO28_36630 [Desulfosarcina ovata subsp. sediminis]|uniref:Radical SAM core domain-containing protein n=1 Tax=Desulfosarcina ovata subsp. sediminis TaxID=885957 RepID=A0A5K7ZSA7_9BACT|nr:PqqD family peptide modification chaperone [Desulfosarcina ovata]BBO83097.1 hypothetical protein DSCO28_36630 [Desulfosarcina ovata subsp. sediminis]
MTFVKQCQSTYIRIFGEIGYITNQISKHDRVYDDIGAVFLKQISRTPKRIVDIVAELSSQFVNVTAQEIENDFTDFVQSLEEEQFIITGETELSLQQKELIFSYNNHQRDIAPSYMNQDNITYPDTGDFFYIYFRKNPHIFDIQIEVTSRCNERCLHCYLPQDRQAQDIDTKMAIDVLDQLVDLKTVSVTFSGGECFLHKDFAKLLKRARQNDLAISILTNGTKINDDYIKVLKEIRVNQIQISLYSMKSQEHDSITQLPGSHKKTLATLEKFLAEDIPVQISCPVMRTNYRSYKNVLQWAHSHRIKAYTDFIMMARTDFTTSNLCERINSHEVEKLIHDMLIYDEEYKALLEIQQPEKPEELRNKPVCGIGIDSLCLTPSGDCYPCGGFQGYIIGNVYKNTLQDIWNNSDAVHKLREITWDKFPKCVQCEAKLYCSMCLVRNFNEGNGDMFKINQHFCDVAFINKRLVDEYHQKNHQI